MTVDISNQEIPAAYPRAGPSLDPKRPLRLSVNSYRPTKTTPAGTTTILFAHASGFHKELWHPVIEYLDAHRERWQGGVMYAMDCTNHGDSAVLNDGLLEDTYDWTDYALDVLQVIDTLGLRKGGGPLIGVGHSLGGCAILSAELARPGAFDAVIAVEPMLYPPLNKDITARGAAPTPLVEATLRRKDKWESRQEAKEYFLKRALFRTWAPEVLDAHVKYGLRDLDDGHGVTLKCPKVQEAAIYAHFPSMVNCFLRLPQIRIPILFIRGETSRENMLEGIMLKSSRAQRGDYITVYNTGHLTVFEKPEETGRLIQDYIHYAVLPPPSAPITAAKL